MIYRTILLVICSTLFTGAVQAQDNASLADQDSSSEQAEQAEAREDAYRKRMELEGSRDPDSFANTTYTSQAKQEKIDKLPKESQDNIRDQLMDVIIENGQWEPFDALREYPYEPSESAQENPGLREREEEAWAEQMEKYHQREANALGARKPPMPGTETQQADGSPDPGGQQGQQQSEQGEGDSDGEQQGDNQGGEGESQNEGEQQGSQGSGSSPASSYDPYQSQQDDDADEISTAGVSESALDFLRAQQTPGSGSAGQDSPQQSVSEFIIPGTIAIKDLDKLEGMAEPEDDSENR